MDNNEIFETKTNYWYYFQIIAVVLALICIVDTALGNPIIKFFTK